MPDRELLIRTAFIAWACVVCAGFFYFSAPTMISKLHEAGFLGG